MKKIIKKITILLFVVFIGIQFVPTTYNTSDKVSETDFVKIFNAPKNIQNLLKTSCYDCHSNNTNYPWYSKIQPGAWLMEGHINEGKEELNFSTFGDYSGRRKKSKLKSIISQIKDDEMPLLSYTFIHRDAKLSEKDKFMLDKWLNNLRDSLQ
ncbi:MAG: heme-binding domain-containing protein [Bacteroidetes bacterium]|nr:heme-binding domain-containing protein [Bacteroidota bacterium]